MEDIEGNLPPSKKRHAGREISRDDPGFDDDDQPEPEMGTFKRASDEVLATRRIVKVRRSASQTPAPSANPFAGIQLIAQTHSTAISDTQTQDITDKQEHQQSASQEGEKVPEDHAFENGGTKEDQVEDKGGNDVQSKEKVDDSENETNNQQCEGLVQGGENDVKEEDKVEESTVKDNPTEVDDGEQHDETGDSSKERENHVDEEESEQNEVKSEEKAEANRQSDDQKDKSESTSPFSSFQQLSSRQNAFTGFSGTGFSAFTGLAGTGFSASSFSFGLLSKEGSGFGKDSGPIIGPNSESTSLSGTIFGSAVDPQLGTKPTMQEVPVETGEENEKVIFKADAILFEYLDGGWKERGKGEVKLNVTTSGSEKARLVMRARGNYRLILNASLYPDMALQSMEKRGVTFACVNSASEAKEGLTTFALKFKEASILDEFKGAVETHKAKKDATVLKTPDNSPKASDD